MKDATKPTVQHPIQLNFAQETAVDTWASDDRLWSTEETVRFNLKTFARVIIGASPSLYHSASLRSEIRELIIHLRNSEAICHVHHVGCPQDDTCDCPGIVLYKKLEKELLGDE